MIRLSAQSNFSDWIHCDCLSRKLATHEITCSVTNVHPRLNSADVSLSPSSFHSSMTLHSEWDAFLRSFSQGTHFEVLTGGFVLYVQSILLKKIPRNVLSNLKKHRCIEFMLGSIDQAQGQCHAVFTWHYCTIDCLEPRATKNEVVILTWRKIMWRKS